MLVETHDPAVRIVMADDSTLLREGLARLFDEAGFTVVATYDSAEPLIAEIEVTRPGLVVLDVRMPPTFRDEGVRAAVALKKSHPGIGVLLLSQYAEVDYANELTEAGGDGVGYLLKDRVSSLTELRDAVTRIVAGGTVIDEQIVRELISRRRDPLSTLTPREVEVLSLMAEGGTNQAIAEALHLGVGTVEKHSTAIFSKLGLDADDGTSHRRVLAVLAWLQRRPGLG
ncbi:LuxR family transcriptional regulator [Frondihabitans sp. PAMC 28766]|uniref:response regulator transcription factor n=1 Tax=Frondihabitans sp. PAMC 28766 TaxID=1795630 RepID=UPI00078EDA8A|nr:response regulator transcription factor [Frondihabitans sp. PAMC 28766]AMM20339.1 LuxR family transcriptional regulator [Frondihabitans sp. PAMC 28766]